MTQAFHLACIIFKVCNACQGNSYKALCTHCRPIILGLYAASFVLFTALSAAVSHPEDQTAENILSSVKPEEVKTIVKKVADEVLGNFKVCMSVGQLVNLSS